jgi:hypothetical protein
MAHEIGFVDSPGYIHIVLHGPIDLAAAELAANDLVTACTARPGLPILGDTREADFSLSATDVYRIASDMASTEVAAVKLAIVNIPRELFDPPTFFGEIGSHRGMRVAQFAEPEEAVAWLTRAS